MGIFILVFQTGAESALKKISGENAAVLWLVVLENQREAALFHVPLQNAGAAPPGASRCEDHVSEKGWELGQGPREQLRGVQKVHLKVLSSS